MTETPSATPHLDLDTLADVLAGEVDGSPHLGSCASCTSRLAELRAAESRVVAVLGTLPPPPVPADLAARLTAALAAEQPPAAASVTALPAGLPERRRTWLPAAAAAVLLFSGAGLGYALLSDGGSDSADTTAGDAGANLVLNASGTDYADPAAVAGVLPGVLEGSAGPVRLSDEGTSAQAGSEAGGSGDGAERSSDDAATTAQAPAAALAGDELARLRTPDGLADCLAALLPPEEPDVQPLALDYATYDGAPALAVLLPDPDPAKLSVFVVGPGCSRADDSTLHFFRVDAP